MWLQCFTIRYTALHIRGYPGLRSNYKLNWLIELFCIYKLLHNAVWLQKFLETQQLPSYQEHYNNNKRDDNRKSPSSCKSTSSEIKAHEVQASPKRLVTVAKLPVELLEDHFAEQLKRLASKELAVYMYSRNHVTAMCHPSVIQRLHIRRYPGLSFKYESNMSRGRVRKFCF